MIILGQDPYHGKGQAQGLCFSVPPGIKAPPSLVNIFKEIPELESIQVGNKIHIRELTNLGDASLIDKAQVWLTNLMAKNKELYASDGYRMAEEAGFNDSVLKRAKQDLPITSKRLENRWKWIWEL